MKPTKHCFQCGEGTETSQVWNLGSDNWKLSAPVFTANKRKEPSNHTCKQLSAKYHRNSPANTSLSSETGKLEDLKLHVPDPLFSYQAILTEVEQLILRILRSKCQ